MSRSFGDNLTKEDVKTIADVRRDVWTSGFKGIGYGLATGYILHTTTRFIHNNILNDATRKKLKAKNIVFNRNTAFFSVLAVGASVPSCSPPAARGRMRFIKYTIFSKLGSMIQNRRISRYTNVPNCRHWKRMRLRYGRKDGFRERYLSIGV